MIIQRAMAVPNFDSGVQSQSVLAEVAILLGTYNGQHHLAEQLDSYAAQTHSNWKVWASDDGSADSTRTVLEAYRQRWPSDRLFIYKGPGEGFVANFLSLVCKADINANYYAFSDQDDVWNADKLECALRWLNTIPENTPALYCSRTILVDAANNEIGFSPQFSKPPSFANAITQNIASGNTMVLNRAARALLYEAGPSVTVAAHDWWTYMVVTGCGGQVFFDQKPSLRYRQHEKNLIGNNASWKARLERIRMLYQGRSRQWSEENIAALSIIKHHLTPENRKTLDEFVKTREAKLIPRIIHLKRSGVYRQTTLGNLGLIAAVIIKKI